MGINEEIVDGLAGRLKGNKLIQVECKVWE